MARTGIGIIGCGNISGIYIKNAYRFENLELVALADMDASRPKAKIEEIKAKAAEWKIPASRLEKLPVACTVAKLLANPKIDIVVNLTIPKVHAEVALRTIAAGKHAYSEKPLGVNVAEGRKILEAAAAKGVRVGAAPDTFLGGGIQTCRKLIDDGWIGKPVAATAFMTCHGHESWHPDPAFYYQPGGGPLFDMGPYYLSALVNLLGPVQQVAGMAKATFPKRTITSAAKFGEEITVNTPTHITAALEFAQGAVATMVMSFDVWAASLPRIEIYGTEGSLSVPDPNSFGGPVKIRRPGMTDWMEVPLCFGYSDNSRMIGVADLAEAVVSQREHRASGTLAFHVLESMQAILDAASSGKNTAVGSYIMRPSALPLGLRDGQIR